MNDEHLGEPRQPWRPPRKKRIWPWVVLIIVVAGVLINITLTI
ncbi:hypothetical protein ACFFV7_46660 [Nonomuraea spiralis]|uniref:Uncharacterized protein n=1 Tax=Nonomuraea spiralis TaxID=46182 RepID=A0ABV5IXN4_9ACTN|nr:hypothetical protein [Nonomuraea spiralis]